MSPVLGIKISIIPPNPEEDDSRFHVAIKFPDVDGNLIGCILKAPGADEAMEALTSWWRENGHLYHGAA